MHRLVNKGVDPSQGPGWGGGGGQGRKEKPLWLQGGGEQRAAPSENRNQKTKLEPHENTTGLKVFKLFLQLMLETSSIAPGAQES